MKIRKRYVYLGILLFGGIAGGYLAFLIFHQPVLMGSVFGCAVSTLIISIFNPNFINDINNKLSQTRKKRLSKVQFHDFKRTIFHPTRLHTYLGLFWGIAIFVVLNRQNSIIPITIIFVFVLFLLFVSLDGYQMIKRNEYINRQGHIVHGFPSRFFGYLIVIFSWSLIIILIFSKIFNW